MKIKRIKFQNYTVFEDQQMEFSPGINVIIGENGTGKTHLMKALYKEQEYNFIPKYSEIYEIGSETFVDDVTVAAEKMAQKIYDYYYM